MLASLVSSPRRLIGAQCRTRGRITPCANTVGKSRIGENILVSRFLGPTPVLTQNFHYANRVHGTGTRFTTINARYYAEQPKKAKENVDIRSFLKSFLMRVHPDFFSKYPNVQAENDRSLKQLNSLLDVVEEYAAKPPGPIQLNRLQVPMKFTTRFYLRPGPKTLAEMKADEQKRKIRNRDERPEDVLPQKPGSEFRVISASYHFPETFFTAPFKREMLEREIQLFLNDLLKQAGLPEFELSAAPESMTAASEAATEQFDEDGVFKPKGVVDRRRMMKALRAEFKEVLEAFMDRHYPAAQAAIDKLGSDWEMHIGRKPEAEVALGVADLHYSSDRERRQIHYGTDLDGEERAAGLLTIEELWTQGIIPNDIPILVTKGKNNFLEPHTLPGFISIPLHFDQDKLEKYLKENLKTIMVTRYNIRSQLTESEYLVNQFVRAFRLAHLEIRASLEHTLLALTAINEVKEEISKRFGRATEGMTWHIVEANALAEAMGEHVNSIWIPVNSTTPDQKNIKTVKRDVKRTTQSANKPTDASSTESEITDQAAKATGTSVQKTGGDSGKNEGGTAVLAESSMPEVDDPVKDFYADLPLQRRAINLSPDELARRAALREQRAQARKGKSLDDWDDEDEEVLVESLDLENFVSEVNQQLAAEYAGEVEGVVDESGPISMESMEALEEEAEEVLEDEHLVAPKGEESSAREEEVLDEFEAAMKEQEYKQAEKVNNEIVYIEGTPLYSLSRDVLLIPYNTSSESMLEWFEHNQAILHFRQKIYPGRMWKRQLHMVSKNVARLLGVKSVTFAPTVIWDKSLQVTALKNLEAHSRLIRDVDLKNAKVIVTPSSMQLDIRKRWLKVPAKFSPTVWAKFLRDLANLREQMRQKNYARKRYV